MKTTMAGSGRRSGAGGRRRARVRGAPPDASGDVPMYVCTVYVYVNTQRTSRIEFVLGLMLYFVYTKQGMDYNEQ
jgi:hypothetical protein